MRLLALITDAWGGRGGIAKVNRDFLAAFAEHPAVDEVVVLPRVVTEAPSPTPPGIDFRAGAAGGAAAFLRAFVAEVARGGYDGVVGGHLNLTPLAAVAAARARVPWFFVVHGVDGWGPEHWPASYGAGREAAVRWAVRRADAFVSVSDLTRQRFSQWMDVPAERGTVIPNSVDAGAFGAGRKRGDLLDRYGLRDKTVVMTLARLSAAEQYKGVDETMEALPALTDEFPDLAYLVCGSGDDRARLEAKAAALGLADRVVFAGYVAEEEKADHYRLADAFAMPGRGEGFGIVYLEALACGVPVVASSADASREAVRDGELGVIVDPDDPASVVEGIRAALHRPNGVPDGLDYFSQARFDERWRRVVDDVFERAGRPAPTPA